LSGVNTIAQTLTIASGAGYKKPVIEIMNAFEKESVIKVDGIFGNLQMIASQAKQSGEVACIIGDKKFLKKLESTVSFVDYTPLGQGIVVIAYRKGITLDSISDLLSPKVSNVFMPDDKKAIYGIAGKELLDFYNYYDSISSKLTQVATVPQVLSYLLTGEADVGIINLTEAINSNGLGGYIIVPQHAYKPIEIVAGTVKGFETNTETMQFLQFLKSAESIQIIKKHGL
jgi:molybdate transport system substrate-binding protein